LFVWHIALQAVGLKRYEIPVSGVPTIPR
jgi:hypothetical protein